MEKSRYLLKYYYIGKTRYHGSQRQPNLLTIEDCILNALYEKNYIKNREDSRFEFASRTDKLVSARGACFSIILEKKPILMEINSILPVEIGMWAYSKVPLDFSSRYSAVLRHYLYLVPTPLSMDKNFESLNIDIMYRACKQLEGTHNFVNFSKRSEKETKTERKIDSVELSIEDDFMLFQFKSRAFLRQQVRRMVKKVLDLGRAIIEYKDFLQLFDPLEEISYQPADPKGVVLWDVVYDDTIILKEDEKSMERMERFFFKRESYFKFKQRLFGLLQQNNFS
ncbi:MAG: tRNA pseudouridine synthase A [Promethearchaeota archaeon]|jgi:tRNA pseudouridine38-40 synthase